LIEKIASGYKSLVSQFFRTPSLRAHDMGRPAWDPATQCARTMVAR